MTEATDGSRLRLLGRFAQAWNQHDAEALMSMMADECVFEAPSGPEVYGIRHEGRQAVQSAFENVFITLPDAHWGQQSHLVAGNRGMSEWILTGTLLNGTAVEVGGCDVFDFLGDKIRAKRTYLKSRRPPSP